MESRFGPSIAGVVVAVVLLAGGGCEKRPSAPSSLTAAPVEIVSKSGVEMIYLSGGRFVMGTDQGDVDEGPLSMGQDAGLIHDIPGAADIVARIAQEAEGNLTRKFPRLLAATR